MPPAARVTDMHVCPMITVLVPHVGGPILPPCMVNVLIGGLPAARIGDLTAHGGVIVTGMPNVIIGEAGSGSGYFAAGAPGLSDGSALIATAEAFSDPKQQAEVLKQAAKEGLPFAELCS